MEKVKLQKNNSHEHIAVKAAARINMRILCIQKQKTIAIMYDDLMLNPSTRSQHSQVQVNYIFDKCSAVDFILSTE